MSQQLVAADDECEIGHDAWPGMSIVVVNYNGRAYIEQCLFSLFNQAYPVYEVIVVDNGSTDGSAEFIEQTFDRVRLVRAEENLGFGQGNNLGAQHARGEYLAFLNPDTVVERDWLFPLVDTLRQEGTVGLATAKILLMDQPGRINACGNNVHMTGLPSCRGWMMAADALAEDEIVSSVSGAAFAMSKRLFDLLGGFDGSFFLYVEDNDLSWRAQLVGYDCQYVPKSVVYHQYRPQFEPSKYFYLERNRYLMLLKSFRGRTLALLMPALVLSELVTWGYALLQGKGYVPAKLRVYKWLVQHSAEVRRARGQVQGRRLVPDHRLLERCSYQLDYQLASDGFAVTVAQAVFDPVFRVFHRACLAMIRW